VTTPFDALTARGRARRMRLVALDALARFGIEASLLRLLAADTNTVFFARAGDGRRLVVRVGTWGPIGHDLRQLRSETEWLAALAADERVPAPVPLETARGERVVEASAPGVPGLRHCVVFEWMPGVLLADRMTPPVLEAYGTLAAHLHRHGAGYRARGGGPVYRGDRVFPYAEPVVLFEGDHPHLPPSRRALFVAAAAGVERGIDALARGGEPMQVMHGDLHIWNVLVSRSGVAAIDFEDHLWGWPIQDLGIALYYLEDRPDFPALVETIRRGYERVAPWPARDPADLDTFIAARALALANDVVHLERAGEPGLDAAGFFARAEQRLRRRVGMG
jgi:Ser/Thr protein kinase RdoA (MazF antagonist)